MKQFADNNLEFDENTRLFSKRVENTVGKGEIARYKQFLLFPPCFQKAGLPGASKDVIVWEWVKLVQTESIFRQQSKCLLQIKKLIGKVENADYRHSIFFRPLHFPKASFPGLLNLRIWLNVAPIITNHSHERSSFFVFFSKVCKFECYISSDWLNHMV